MKEQYNIIIIHNTFLAGLTILYKFLDIFHIQFECEKYIRIFYKKLLVPLWILIILCPHQKPWPNFLESLLRGATISLASQ